MKYSTYFGGVGLVGEWFTTFAVTPYPYKPPAERTLQATTGSAACDVMPCSVAGDMGMSQQAL